MRHAVLLSSLALVVPAAGAVLTFTACGGHLISIGTNSAELSAIEPSSVGGGGSAVPACAPGTQHPNVCCLANVGSGPVACGVFPAGAGFQPCNPGDETFPDPRFCCDVDDPSTCAPPPSGASQPAAACNTVCPPGYDTNGASCCKVAADGTQQCYSVDPSAAGGVANSGCIEYPTDDASIPPDSGGIPFCPPGGTGQIACNLDCPAGWSRNLFVVDMCCRQFDGATQCYSQSQGPLPPLATTTCVAPSPGDGGYWPEGYDAGCIDTSDAGPILSEPDAGQPLPLDASAPGSQDCYGTPGSIDGGPGQCGCAENVAGIVYTVYCDDVAATCECEVNGQVVRTLAPGTLTCNGGVLPFADCGFPPSP